jgi:hypothetical protein
MRSSFVMEITPDCLQNVGAMRSLSGAGLRDYWP